MRTRLLRFIAAVLLLFSLALPFAAGQSGLPSIERGVSVDPSAEGEKSGSSTAALPYFVMAVYTMLVMTIVCMPSRKA